MPNLYSHLYRSLVFQLESGGYPAGQPLPSQQQLCRQYNVGITTVRKVMKMLSDNGYIRTSHGQRAMVVFRTSPEAQAAALVGRRKEIMDAYQGIRLILPVLYLEGAKRAGPGELRIMRQAAARITDDADDACTYRNANLFFTVLIRLFQNPLILELELDAENYFHIPYIALPGIPNPFKISPARVRNWLQNACVQIGNRQYDEFYQSVLLFYDDAGRKIVRYLDALASRVEPVAPLRKEQTWFRIKGRTELYSRVALAMIHRITCGEFDGQKYLPSIPKIMREYGVTKETASRAVSLLAAMGIIRTIDKKGIVSVLGNPLSGCASANLSDPAIQRRITLCVCSLQFLSLISENCASVLSPLPAQWGREMERQLACVSDDWVSTISIQLLMNGSERLTPLHSLQNMYRQFNELMIWGYYLRSADKSLYPKAAAVSRAMAAATAAVKGGEKQAFPRALKDVFLQVYRDTYSMILALPHEFNPLPIPL